MFADCWSIKRNENRWYYQATRMALRNMNKTINLTNWNRNSKTAMEKHERMYQRLRELNRVDILGKARKPIRLLCSIGGSGRDIIFQTIKNFLVWGTTITEKLSCDSGRCHYRMDSLCYNQSKASLIIMSSRARAVQNGGVTFREQWRWLIECIVLYCSNY